MSIEVYVKEIAKLPDIVATVIEKSKEYILPLEIKKKYAILNTLKFLPQHVRAIKMFIVTYLVCMQRLLPNKRIEGGARSKTSRRTRRKHTKRRQKRRSSQNRPNKLFQKGGNKFLANILACFSFAPFICSGLLNNSLPRHQRQPAIDDIADSFDLIKDFSFLMFNENGTCAIITLIFLKAITIDDTFNALSNAFFNDSEYGEFVRNIKKDGELASVTPRDLQNDQGFDNIVKLIIDKIKNNKKSEDFATFLSYPTKSKNRHAVSLYFVAENENLIVVDPQTNFQQTTFKRKIYALKDDEKFEEKKFAFHSLREYFNTYVEEENPHFFFLTNVPYHFGTSILHDHGATKTKVKQLNDQLNRTTDVVVTKGKKYTGDWVNLLRDGYGILNDDSGRKIYEGNFEHGQYNGSGILYDDSGLKKYEGNFKNGKFDGYGEHMVHQLVFKGQFNEGKRIKGDIYYTNDPDIIFMHYEKK